MQSLSDHWLAIPPAQRLFFTVDDLYIEPDNHLKMVKDISIESFALQMFRPPGTSRCCYHFHFKLKEKVNCVRQGSAAQIDAFAMWMQPGGDQSNPLEGTLMFRLDLTDFDYLHPLASFEFEFLDDVDRPDDEKLTLFYLVETLQGRAPGLPDAQCANLLRFEFQQTGDEYLGHRDVLTQWMIRFNNINIVTWSSPFQSVDYFHFDGDDDVMNCCDFDTIIQGRMTSDGIRGRDNKLIIHVTKRPLRRGVWLDRRYTRIMVHENRTLPYDENSS